jgi:chromosome segregation ATPase
MSTAGKVLAVLVMLMSLVWMVLSAGVDQLNTNGNKKLHDLAEQIEKLEGEVEQARDDLVALKSSASTVQESLDYEATVLHARQSDLEKDRSQIKELLSNWQYQLDTAKETIDRAKTALQHRTDEHEGSQQLLAKTKSEVKELMDRCGELTNELLALRKEFNSTYQANVDSLGKTR